MLVSTSIFIGVLAVVSLFTVRDLITRQLTNDVREDELTMIDVIVRPEIDAPIDNDLFLETLNQQNAAGQALAELNGIERVEGHAFYSINFRDADGEFKQAEIRAYDKALPDVELEPLRLVRGRWPTVGSNQVALEVRMAEVNGFDVGDEIVFQTASTDGVGQATFTVSGLVFHPYSFTNPGAQGSSGLGPEDGIYAEYDDAQALLNFRGFNAFVARYESFALAEENFDAFQTAISENTNYIPLFALLENPAENLQLVNAENTVNVLSLLALVSVIISGFLVVNVVNIILVEQKSQIGIMKLIGASYRDNYTIYSGIALMYGLFGTFPALIAGIFLGLEISKSLATTLDILIEGFQISPSSIVAGLILGLAVPMIAATIPVFNGVRINIVEALNDLGISDNYGRGFMARVIGLLPLPISVRQAVSNVYKKRGRLALTGTTLTVAIAAFMGVLAIGISLNDAVQAIFNRLNYEILVVPNDLHNFDEVRETLIAVDGVRDVRPGTLVNLSIEGPYTNFFTQNNQVASFSIDTTADVFTFDLIDGTGWEEDPQREGVIITSPMAAQLGVGDGDTVTFTLAGQTFTENIIGVDKSAFDFFYMRWERMSELAGIRAGVPRPNQFVVDAQLAGRDEALAALGIDEIASTFLIGRGLEDGEILVTTALARRANLREGDVVSVSIGDYTGEYTIVGIVDVPPQIENAPDEGIAFAFDELVDITGVSLNGAPTPNSYFVIMDANNPTTSEADEVMERVRETLVANDIAALVQNQLQQSEDISVFINQFISILLIAAILIALVGAIGLLTTLTISVLERQREIGVMRSIGAGSSTIALQFLVEGLIVGIISYILAIPLGIGIALVLNNALGFENIEFEFPPVTLLIGFIGMLLLTTLASIGPALNSSRKTVSDILRYQ